MNHWRTQLDFYRMAKIITTGATILEIAFVTLAFFLVVLFTRQVGKVPKGLRLPPGPRRKPIIGNATDMPLRHPWETFTRWGKEYGDLVYVEVLGQHIVLVSSQDVAHDLLETKSSIYSDRGDFPMLKLMGHEWDFAIMRYGERWRRSRKAFHQHFHATASAAYHNIQTRHTRDLLRKLQQSPDDFVQHLRRLAGGTIMEVIYGIRILPVADPYIGIAEKAAEGAAEAGNPGAFLVDTFPILKYVPEWMPGAGFQRKARAWRVPTTEMAMLPFMAVKEYLRTGTARPSVTSSLLEKNCDRENVPADEEEIIRGLAATSYLAGSDTTVSSLHSFILAMVLYPDVQRKAQSELDSVVGMGRLPTYEDRTDLPYTNALCKEVLRWRPVFPLGIPHWVMQDDAYGDHFIPRGTMVIANAWAMLHDEKVYGPEPDKFEPERFLKPGVKDPCSFGFGRRMCPGRHLAQNSIFLAVASILQVFSISLARDGEGNEIFVSRLFTPGLASHPEPFKCSIKPRSASAVSLLSTRIDD